MPSKFTFLLFYLLILFSISSKTIKTQNPTPKDDFPNYVILQRPDLIYLYWSHDQSEIKFEIHFKNITKWLMFGLSSTNYSDVIITWLNDDGTGHFSDRKFSMLDGLTFDSKQNWLIQDAYIENNYRVVQFKRNIKLCNSGLLEDLDIQEGSNTVVFSTGQLADDINGHLSDFNISTVSSIDQFNFLTENDGPYNCSSEKSPPIFTSQPTAYYSNYFDLVEGVYRFYWNVTKNELIGEIHVATSGWVGFGVSPNGGMDKSDIFVGWISNNSVNFTDRYINGRQVLIDSIQNWILLDSAEKGGYTIFKFKRALKSCHPNDLSIDIGSPFIIFAYGPNDPLPGEDITYHQSSKGTKVVNIVTQSNNKEVVIPNEEIFEFSANNVVLPKDTDTFYYCKLIEIPSNLTQKRHILKWEVELPKINFQNMHHLVIYECNERYNGTPIFTPGNCFTSEVKNEFCYRLTFTWAYGGSTVSYFPKNTGYPIGGDTNYRYIVMEIHYNNPDFNIGYIDYVKVRYHMTTSLQPNELGVFTTGANMDPFSISIPPKVAKFGINTYCYKNCLEKYLANENITIVAAGPHTHLTGNAVYTKIIRNGYDIGYLFNNKFYDFNYQDYYLLDPPVNITKNDDLITYCQYTTLNRTKFTNIGFGTQQEMCLHFFLYYPRRIGTSYCVSSAYFGEVANFLQSLNDTGDINIQPFDKTNFSSVYSTYYNDFLGENKNYSLEKLGNKFLDFYNRTKVINLCNMENDYSTAYDQIRPSNQYVEPNLCQVSTTSAPSLITQTPDILTNLNFFASIFNWIISWFRW